MKKVDLITIEIGSTITKANAFIGINTPNPQFVGKGYALTSVDTDVVIGMENSIKDLCIKNKFKDLQWDEMLASSSAAGGLIMTVHGLTYDMTVKAAREASLGAGAVIKLVTSGKLESFNLDEIYRISPKLVILAGGVDYGEREVIIHNAHKLAEANLNAPILYAGNIEIQEKVKSIFAYKNKEITIVPNVYPEVDTLDIEPARREIQHLFSKHIVEAPGMSRIREMIKEDKEIIPVPGAVMNCSIMLYNVIGDLVVVDVGGATTDVHSVTDGSEQYKVMMVEPEPLSKRTVEGDLGVYVNAKNIYDYHLGEHIHIGMDKLKAIPHNDEEMELTRELTEKAVRIGIDRHCGKIKAAYTFTGKKSIVKGKDLTNVQYIIGTGGALTQLPHGKEILSKVRVAEIQEKLFPTKVAKVLVDKNYIMSSIGLMAEYYKDTAEFLIRDSLNIDK